MRYIGVDLHKTNLVVCFLSVRGPERIVTFSLEDAGLAAFRRQLRPDDEVAVDSNSRLALQARKMGVGA